MEYVTHIHRWELVRMPLHEDIAAKRVFERAQKGYYRVIDASSGDMGVDMRGKTTSPIHSYFVRGALHFLDGKTYGILQKYFLKRRFLTVLAKTLIEKGDYAWLAQEYDLPTDSFPVSKGDSQLAAALASMA